MPDRVKPGFEGFGELLPREDRDRVLRRLQPCRLETQTLVTIRLSPSLPPSLPLRRIKTAAGLQAGLAGVVFIPIPILCWTRPSGPSNPGFSRNLARTRHAGLGSFLPLQYCFLPLQYYRTWQLPAVTILEDFSASCRYNSPPPHVGASSLTHLSPAAKST